MQRQVFLTGATGYLGSSVGAVLARHGNEVRGLVRSPAKADAVRALGMIPVLGTLEDTRLLAREAARSDGVVNVATEDAAPVRALLSGLRGSGKPLVHVAGSSLVGEDALGGSAGRIVTDDADLPPVHPLHRDRARLVRRIRAAGRADGVRTAVALVPTVYGDSLGLPAQSIQVPLVRSLVQAQTGPAVIGAGVNRWSTVHVADLARLLELMLASSAPGEILAAEDGELSAAELATAVAGAEGLTAPLRHLTPAEAIDATADSLRPRIPSTATPRSLREVGDLVGTAAPVLLTGWKDRRLYGAAPAGGFVERSVLGALVRIALASSSRIRGVRARTQLGWEPSGPSLREWLGV